MKSVFARISTAIIAVAAVAASALIATAPASATPSTTNVTKLSYTMAWQPGGTTPVTLDATRLDFNVTYRYRDAGSLVGHALTVQTLASGLPSGKSLYDYAYVTFYTENAMTNPITFPNPCGSGTTGGVQLNAAGSGGQCMTVTVPANTVAINISYTVAFNGSTGSYSNVIPAGTNVTATPRVYDNGMLLSATGVASNAATPSGLYYVTNYSSSNVQGYSTSMTLPATGVINQATASVAACVDFTGFRGASSDTIPASLKINGTAVDSMNSGYSWGIAGDSNFPVYGATLGANFNSSIGDWETARVKTLQVNAAGTIYGPALGSTVTPSIDVTKGSTSVLISCTPETPTATGTLGSSAGSLSFTPDASFAGKSWVVNVYRNDNDVLVGSGSGSGTTAARVNGISSMNMPPAAIPFGVPMYAKVAGSRSISDSQGGGGTTFSSPFTSAKSAVYTLAAPAVTFPVSPSGLTTEGSAGITADTLNYSAQVPATSFMMDNTSFGMGAKRMPVSDDKGGFWYWNDDMNVGPNNSVTGSVKLYHYTPAGLDTSFGGGTGVAIETTPEYPLMTMGWAGDRDHWVAAVTKDSSTYNLSGPTAWADYHYGLDIVTGTMNGSFSKKSYTYAQMDAFCSSVYPNSKLKTVTVTVVSNPTNDPWLSIPCGNDIDSNMVNATRIVLAKSTSAGLVSLFAINNTDATVDNYASIMGSSIYPSASADTDTALVVTFATGRATSTSQLSGRTTPVVKRGLVRISKAGIATALVGEAAWHEATPSATVAAITTNASFVAIPWLSANGVLLGLTKNGSNFAVLDAGTAGGFATATSADNITFDEIATPAAFTTAPGLSWARGGSNVVGLTTAPVLTRTGATMGVTPSYNLAQAKIDWSTRKVSTNEIINYERPIVSGVIATTFVDTSGRLNLAYTKAQNQLGFVRWVGGASLPDGVNVTGQSTSYVLNAGGDVVLNGSGLGATTGATKVLTAKVNGVAATIKSRTANSLTITAPADNTATAQAPVTGNIELGFAGDQGGVVGQLTYVGATKLTPVITQTLASTSAFFGDADRDFSASATMSPVTVTPNTSTTAACSIVNNKVRFLTAGTCTVTSTVAATSYSNALSQSTSITVNKPTPTVTLNVGALTAYASDPDRTVTASATLDTGGTAPTPVVSASPSGVCTIVAGKVHFVTSGNCVVSAAIAASTAINAGSATPATIVVTKLTPTVSVSVAGDANALVGDEDRAITVTASAGAPSLTSTTPLVCSIVPAAGQTPNKVHFVGATGNCVVKAQVSASATFNVSNAALSTAIAVRKPNTISTGWAAGFDANASADVADAPIPAITTASGEAATVTSSTPLVCEVTEDGAVWIHTRDVTCTLHIVTPASGAVWAQQELDWNITTLPAIGDSEASALKVRNDNVVVGLSAIALKWNQKTNQVYFVTKAKRVGPVIAEMTFTGRDNTVYTCRVNFGTKAKVAKALVGTVKVTTSGAFCTDAALKGVDKTNQTTAYNAFKDLVTFNTGLGQGTVVKFRYNFERHRDDNYALVGKALTDPTNWSADAFANLYYLATDSITAALPAGATTAPVSATEAGAFVPSIAFESKRLDYTLTSTDDTKCEVTGDGRIWAKAAGENCTITVATAANTAVWEQKSKSWTFAMSAAAVAADAASAVIAPSNNTAVNVGPLVITWNQATSAVVAKFTSRNPGKVSAKMTFTGLDNVSYSCTVDFGTTAAIPAAARGSYVTQANTVKFCGDTKLIGADKTAQTTALAKFTDLVKARKSGVGQGVIPATFAYKFEQHSRVDGSLIGSMLADQSFSAGLVVKLNWRATAN